MNKNVLSVAAVLAMSSGINTFVNADEINIINETGVVTATSGLNVRKTPKVSNDNKLFAITYNTKVKILSKEDGWYKIEVNNRQGYVSGDYIKITSDSSNSSNTSTSTTYKYVSGSRVNFRSGSSTSSKVIDVLTKGTKVKFISSSGNWSKIQYNNQTGYMYSDYLSSESISSDSSTSITYKYVSGSRVNFRSGSSSSSKVIKVLTKGTKVKFISKSGDWSKIEYNNQTGYMHSDYLSSENPSSGSTGSTDSSGSSGGSSESTDSSDSSNSDSISVKRQKIVALASEQIGKPYVWGAQGPDSFDCSGLVTYVYNNALGMSLPRTSLEQSKFGTIIDKSELKEGDLIFSSTNGTGNVSHVGIYVGNGEMIHAPKPGDTIKKVSINNSYWNGVYLWSTRVL